MRLQDSKAFPFTHISPIYNWIYPFSAIGRPVSYEGRKIEEIIGRSAYAIGTRALYLHVPFCETICSFCPLLKGPLGKSEVLDTYVDALIAEIRWKGSDKELTRLPIRAIFFGGGTPSLLKPQHIVAIGKALGEAFDLHALEEFSVEMEVKSIAPRILEAFRGIGVTHARFGLQTFSRRHREALNLTATIEQIHSAATILPTYFPHVSCDVLYGLPGQTVDELYYDIEMSTKLGLENLDFYPLNTFVVQRRMHREYERKGLRPLSETVKSYMGRALRLALESKSFYPHNGHGYVHLDESSPLNKDTVVTDAYSFKYHEYVYGTVHHEYIGIGNGAQSYVGGYTIENTASRDQYVKETLYDRRPRARVRTHSDQVNAAKALAITLPYSGSIKRKSIDWEAIPHYLRDRLNELSDNGLLSGDNDTISLTRDGWHWYTNIMYYLSPEEERSALNELIFRSDERRMHSVDIDTLVRAQ